MTTLTFPPYTITLREGFPAANTHAENAGGTPVLVLDEGHSPPTSCHRIHVAENGVAVGSAQVQASTGATGIHEHSAVVADDILFLACGPFVAALRLPSLELQWCTQVDEATCFGVYLNTRHYCLITHGELSIARVNFDGSLVWQAMGADIFTEGFETHDEQVSAVDSAGRTYQFEISTGHSLPG
jgi:hypothetical protein